MKHIPRASIEEARRVALPILLEGWRRRGRRRSDGEREQRADVKLARDDERNTPPEICTI